MTEYRLLRGSHSVMEKGTRVSYKAGEIIDLSETQAKAFANKFEKVHPDDEAPVDEGAETTYTAVHVGGGSWEIKNDRGEVVEHGLKKQEAQDRADELNEEKD